MLTIFNISMIWAGANGGVFVFFGSSLTQVRCCMLTTAPQDMGLWVCNCWPTCGSAMLFWSLWNTIQRSSLSMFPSSPHTHYGKMNMCSLFLIYGQVKSPYSGSHLINWLIKDSILFCILCGQTLLYSHPADNCTWVRKMSILTQLMRSISLE